MTASATELEVVQHFIGGRDVPSAAGGTFESIDPATGEPWAVVAEGGSSDVDAAFASAHEALAGEWGRLSPTRRGRLLMRLADAIAANAERIGALETRDNGKL